MALAYAEISSPRLAVSMAKAERVEPGWDLGRYIVEEYWRRRMDWNVSALARASNVNRGTLIYIVKGFRGDGTPVEPLPNTLRQIARGLALGDSDPEAAELIYEKLMDLAGYLPRVTPRHQPSSDPEAEARRWEAKRAEMQRRYDERMARTAKLLEEIWQPEESAQ